MNIFSIKKAGFTLVEILVVVAIIGILSSVAIVNLSSAKDKAKRARVLSQLSELSAAIIVCQDDNKNVTFDGSTECSGNQAPLVEQSVCLNSVATWPTLVDGWIYDANCNSDVSQNTWVYQACESTGANCDSGKKRVNCSQGGCTVDDTP